MNMLMPVYEVGGAPKQRLEGVQLPCDLSRYRQSVQAAQPGTHDQGRNREIEPRLLQRFGEVQVQAKLQARFRQRLGTRKIGRASCRERGESPVAAVSRKETSSR